MLRNRPQRRHASLWRLIVAVIFEAASCQTRRILFRRAAWRQHLSILIHCLRRRVRSDSVLESVVTSSAAVRFADGLDATRPRSITVASTTRQRRQQLQQHQHQQRREKHPVYVMVGAVSTEQQRCVYVIALMPRRLLARPTMSEFLLRLFYGGTKSNSLHENDRVSTYSHPADRLSVALKFGAKRRSDTFCTISFQLAYGTIDNHFRAV